MAAPRPLQPTRPQKRALLSEHFTWAVEEMLRNGAAYSDLTVAEMIRSVGVSRATFYAYFDDKADLLIAMGENVTTNLAAAGASWFDAESMTREDLEAAIDELFAVYRHRQHLLRALTEGAAYDQRVRSLHAELVAQAVSGVQTHIERRIRLGISRNDIDARRSAFWLVWMLERGQYQLVATADGEEVAALASAAADIIWATLYA